MSEHVFNDNKTFSAFLTKNKASLSLGSTGHLMIIAGLGASFLSMRSCGCVGASKMDRAEEEAEQIYKENLIALDKTDPVPLEVIRLFLNVDRLVFRSKGEPFLTVVEQ